MRIVVPSLGRAGTSASAVWLEKQKRKVTFAVHKNEVAAYEKAYPWADTMTLPDTCRGHAGLVRREMLNRVRGKVLFADDDVHVRLTRAKSYDQMFDFLEDHLERVPMAGIGMQIFSQGLVAKSGRIGKDPLAIRNKFVSIVYGLDVKVFRDCPLEELPVYEDAALILHALARGGTIVSFSATHTNKSPALGGCNAWRTPKIVKDSMKKLAALYPEMVKIIPSRHKTQSTDLGLAVRISWKKAADAGVR